MTRKILIGGTAAAIAVTATFAFADMRHSGMGMGEGMRGEGPRMDFATLDANGDGSITPEDIEALREGRFAALDANGDGEVSRQEFMDHSAAQAGERAGTMFDRMDADGDGTLGRDAIESRRGPGPDAGRLISRFDSDGDGAISQDEFGAAQAQLRGRMGDRMERGGRMEHGDRMERGGRMEHGDGPRWRHND